MELCENLYQVKGRVIAMNYDGNMDMSSVIIRRPTGVPLMLEVYDGHLAELIEDLTYDDSVIRNPRR